ncbi:hypothetical protein B484DRAFT_399403 [Ochromonadaceae sp. CCMP2298]|nr:hypothetical protein B484DRAFT_399403 [Ochromonadaceae sp. CCMP2298]
MRVANYLSVKQLCVFDTAITEKLLRAKYLSGLMNDTFLYLGDYGYKRKSTERQQKYAQWLTLRRVVVKSIVLDENTTASVLVLYDTMNRVNPGLVSLKITGRVDFPKDMAVRNNKTLHRLDLGVQGIEELRKCMQSVREWESGGGSLQELTLINCDFGNEAVNFFGSCDALTGDSLGCTRLLWGILTKCKNLKREAAVRGVAMKCTKLETLHLVVETAFTDRTIEAIAANLVSLRRLNMRELQLKNPRTLRVLALGCPQLQIVEIEKSNVNEAELCYLVKHAKKLRTLTIGEWEHLDFQNSWLEIEPDDSAAEELLQLGIDDPEALLSSQSDRIQVLSAATQQPGETDTAEKLKAASSNPNLKIIFESY